MIDDTDFFSFDEEEKEELSKKDIKEIKEEKKTEIKDNITVLESNIQSILDTIEEPVEQLFPSNDLLPGLDMEIVTHDYEKDIQLVKITATETISCLANLYLDETIMKNKNINSIIKDDALKLSELNFNIIQAKRALILCMKQLDFGVANPEMFQSVTMFQKEMRDTIKMSYDLQLKMKDFYKGLKDELEEVNKGNDLEDGLNASNLTVIGDPKELNNILDSYKDDPTLLDYNVVVDDNDD